MPEDLFRRIPTAPATVSGYFVRTKRTWDWIGETFAASAESAVARVAAAEGMDPDELEAVPMLPLGRY